MAKSVKFELDHGGIVAFLQGAECQALVGDVAHRVAASCDIDTEVETVIAGDRAAGRISPDGFKARLENSESNTLLKAIGGASV